MEHTVTRIWKGFWQLADPKIWIASTIPMLVGIALAYTHTGTFELKWIAFALLGIYLIEIGKNAVNEFVDYWTGVDRFVAPEKRNPFSGGKKTIIDGKLSMVETAIIAFITLAAAFVVGLLIALYREPNVFWIGMVGGILAVFYSLPPFKLNYNGLGECAIGISFGPLLVLGMYVMLTGQLDWQIAAMGFPIAFLITNVIWINQYPDFEADLQGGKRNWLVRIGKKRGIHVFAVLFVGAYLSLGVIAIFDQNPYWLLGLLSIPIAVRAVKTAAANLNNNAAFLKANALMIQVYQLVGIAMVTAALLAG